MPTLLFPITLDVNPEKFLKACSIVELQEISLLIDKEIQRRHNNPTEYPQTKDVGKIYMVDPKDFREFEEEPLKLTEDGK